ncbi:MAG: DUF1566 domain-containing protein [Sulfuricella sp.]|nr:DUF1566 domain-containing protein [Sulfuricella sp.]
MTRKPTRFSFLVFLVLSAAAPAWAAFTDNGDGTVTDSVTGLMWDKCTWGQTNNADCSGGSVVNWNTWAQALARAATANGSAYKGHGDWRLPNIKELESLLKIDATSSPTIDTTAFPNTPSSSSYFWSSTPSFTQPNSAWIIYFDNYVMMSSVSGKINYVDAFVRLVRGGQPSGAFDSQDGTAPVYQGATLGAGNTVATLTFDEALANNLADLAALKAAVTFAADGTSFTAPAAGDTVALSGSTLTVTFATPLTGGANQLKVAANSLKDASDNVVASVTATGSPAYQSVAINGSNTVATLTFTGTPLNNLADLAALKAAITLAADGTNYAALAAGDAVALSGSTLTVTFATPLVGTANQLKIAANSLKNGMGTLLAGATTVPLAAYDIIPPVYTGAALNAGMTVLTATLSFDEPLVNNLADLAALKAAITFAADGTTFNALAGGDTVALSGSTLVVTFAAPLTGSTNKLNISANSLKDAIGNVLASAVTTAALDAADSTPSTFSFTAATGAALNSVIESAAITVTGINIAGAISIGGGQYAVSTNSGATWGAYTASAGTVNFNDQVKVKLTSSASYSTVVTAMLTIGGVSGAFVSVTQAASSGSGSSTPTVINVTGGETTLTGTTPVSPAPGSTLVVAAGASVSGVPITLAAPVAGTVTAPVTIKVGGNTLTVTPVGATAIVTLKTLTLNGVPTPVLAVSSGTVTVSAAPGQPLLTVGNSGVVVSAGTGGGTVVFDGSGVATLSVTSGYVVLPANAFAAIPLTKDGKLYAGEIAQLDVNGKVTQVRLGSPAGDGGAVGDPLKPADFIKAVVPNLNGKVARISATRMFADVLAAAVDQDVTAQGQNSDGVLHFAIPGGSVNALPVGSITVDTSRPDGVTLTGTGNAEVVKSGVVTTIVPAIGDFTRFVRQLAKLDKNAILSVLEDGTVHVRLNNVTYVLRPAWTVKPADGGQAVSSDEQGNLVYQDGAGNRQALFPAFADLPQLIAAFQPLDVGATVAANGDGSYRAKLLGKSYVLTPDFNLSVTPADQAAKSWWLDAGGKVFIKNSDGNAQGFGVK